jgi:FtsZ-interacting cell division protein ZipA
MASELSQFIEKELQAQGVHDDEEQRLLSDLRVKPLAVEAGVSQGGIKSWLGRYKTVLLVLVGVLVVVGAVVGAGSYYSGVVTTRDIEDVVDGAAKKMPPLEGADEMGREYEDDDEYDDVEKKKSVGTEYDDEDEDDEAEYDQDEAEYDDDMEDPKPKEEKKADDKEKKTESDDDDSDKKENKDTDKKEAKEDKKKKQDDEYEEYDYTEDSPTPVKE